MSEPADEAFLELQRECLTELSAHLDELRSDLAAFRARDAVDFCRRHGGPLAFVVFDLDQFHEVNERYGALGGDQVLLHVANVFRSSGRASDVFRSV